MAIAGRACSENRKLAGGRFPPPPKSLHINLSSLGHEKEVEDRLTIGECIPVDTLPPQFTRDSSNFLAPLPGVKC